MKELFADHVQPEPVWTIGLDIGSTAVKAVLMKDGRLAGNIMMPTGWNPGVSGEEASAELIKREGLDNSCVARSVSTGYGRNSVKSDANVTEISCHALGAWYLFRGEGESRSRVRTILDIGGQDSKVISLDGSGNVLNFLMNDKCAAGTGRFLQNMAVMLGCTLEDFSSLPEGTTPHVISSMCTVFAESEVVGLLARGVPKDELALGILDAVASRAEGMLRRVGLREDVAFTGGVAQSRNLLMLLEKRLGCAVSVNEYSQYAGAVGAALLAYRQTKSLRK